MGSVWRRWLLEKIKDLTVSLLLLAISNLIDPNLYKEYLRLFGPQILSDIPSAAKHDLMKARHV